MDVDVDVDEECDSLQSSSDSLEPLNNHSSYEDQDGVLRVTFVSFGHKFGVDPTANKIFNIRSLPNPPNRKGKTGLDEDLVKELFAIRDVGVIYNRIKGEIESILALHDVDKDGLELRIGIGCHSGKHRSVAFVEQLAWEMWMPPKGAIQVRAIREHRDIKKKGSQAHKRQHKR